MMIRNEQWEMINEKWSTINNQWSVRNDQCSMRNEKKNTWTMWDRDGIQFTR